jgi:hypothetical protein
VSDIFTASAITSPEKSLLYRLNWRLQKFGTNCGEGVVPCGREEKGVSVLVDTWKWRPLGISKCVEKDNIKMDLRTY